MRVEAQITKMGKFTRGDSVLLTAPDWGTIEDAAKAIQRANIDPAASTDENGVVFPVPLIRLGPNVTIETVDEETMNKHGWFRK